MTLDFLDQKILDIIQYSFPLVERPFLVIAEKLEVSEEEVLGRVRRLKEEGIIRQISAIFDARMLGYQSVLVAMKVNEAYVDIVGEEVSKCSYVSHNYLRDNEINLWFTLALPSNISLASFIKRLTELEGVREYYVLPAVRIFKNTVKFNFTGLDSSCKEEEPRVVEKVRSKSLSDQDIALIRELERDIELSFRPFAKPAYRLRISEKTLLEAAKELERKGIMKRFAAVLRHYKVGYIANCLLCMKVSEDDANRIGIIVSSFPEVSHCFERTGFPNEEYNLFTVIHERSRKRCDDVIDKILKFTGAKHYLSLYSVKEYKMKREYFIQS
ncbi:MAG: AsnC family transcriptional regulator [archaeon]|nr:Lrp/AsnC family transcriptional regulator [archaeon]MCP8319599.1 AsnC family transcriptional regulator [archaeon]